MSQQQAMRRGGSSEQGQGIKYGDVFAVTGDLAAQSIAPQDAAMMQTAENAMLGHTQKGGPAAAMQSAAAHNERAGIDAHDRPSDIPRRQGVTVAETRVPGGRIVTEFVAGQEATSKLLADKPVGRDDAAEVAEAEVGNKPDMATTPGGVGASVAAAARLIQDRQ